MNRLSFSQIRQYMECPRKYFYHYRQRYRSKFHKGFFLFGSAIDSALNHLLLTKDYQGSLEKFDEAFTWNYINNVKTYMPEAINMVWAEADFDQDLLKSEDFEKFKTLYNSLRDDKFEEKIIKFFVKNKDDEQVEQIRQYEVKDCLKEILEQKEKKGFINLSEDNKKLYSMANWLSLRRKGLVMIESYNRKIIPKIKKVILVQGTTSLKNSEGDSVDGYLDIILTWEDDKNYLADNKTSARPYNENAAEISPQLIGYYHSVKEQYELHGVGFFVMQKNILKNKTKICEKCGKDGSGQRHKKCNAMLNDPGHGTGDAFDYRCNGKWIETIDPDCFIDVIFSKVPDTAESLVLEAYDCANEGIKKEAFGPNLNACGASNSEFRCQFFSKCWKGSDEELVKVEK